jgi:hypothetical protein
MNQVLIKGCILLIGTVLMMVGLMYILTGMTLW